MATFLDLSLFGYFGSIFIFLFLFALIWGVLSLSKIFKDIPGEKGIYGLIALSISLLATMSKSFTLLLTTMAPWFVVLMVFLFLVFIVFRMFSGDDGTQISEAIKNPGIFWTVIILSFIILISSFSSTFGQDLLNDQDVQTVNIDDRNEVAYEPSQEIDTDVIDTTNNYDYGSSNANSNDATVTPGAPGSTATDDFSGNVLGTFIHPKVMGMIMMMLISFFAILLIARTPDPD